MAINDLSGNLAIQQEINNLVKDLKVHSDEVTKTIRSQADIMEKFLGMLNDASKKMNENTASTQNATDSIENAAKSAKKFGLNIDGAVNSLIDLDGKSKKTKESLDESSKSLKKVFDVALNAAKKVGHQFTLTNSLLTSFASGIFGIGQSILAIPLGIFNQIASEASAAANQINPITQEMENLREKMGDLSKGPASDVIKSFNRLRESSDNLGKSGISLTHIFGIDREGAAKALAHLGELAVSMGPVFETLSKEFESSADKLIILQKGMSLSGEEMKSFGEIALATGRDLTDVLNENASMSIQMAERFGLSSKVIGKDLTYMSQNMGKFGSMTKAQMGTAAVFTRKLGLEIKQLDGLIGTFDDFEGAATSASKLAQAFGMNVDAMKMMQEQDPAKRLDMLRQSFAATGKSIENMTRQEKALLAQTAGLDENTVSLALSSKNMGLSYEDIQKEAEKAGSKQLSQTEIMEKMGENVKKMLEALNKTTSSFFQTFINGVSFGIERSEEYREMMYSVRRALNETFRFGSKVGRMFIQMFPGVKQMITSLRDFFSPNLMEERIKKMTEVFQTFFADLQKNPKKAVEKFMDSVKKMFFNFFDPKTSEAKGIIDGLKTFLLTLSKAFAGFAAAAIAQISKGVKQIAAFIRNPDGMDTAALGFVGEIIDPIWNALSEAIPTLLESLFFDLLPAILEKYGSKLALIIAGYFALNMAIGITKSIAQTVFVTAVQGLVKYLAGLALPSIPDGQAKAGKSLTEAIDAIGIIAKKASEIKVNWGAALKGILAAAGFALVGILAFAVAVAGAAYVLSGTDWKDIEKVFAATGLGLIAALGLALISLLFVSDGGATIAAGTLGMLAAALFTSVGIVGFALAILAANSILAGIDFKRVTEIFAAVGFALAATLGLVAASVAGLAVLAMGPSAIAGLVVAAGFMIAGVYVFVSALKYIEKQFGGDNIDVKKIGKILLNAGIAVGITIIMAIAGAAAVNFAPLMLIAVAGILAVAAFLITTIPTILDVLNEIQKMNVGNTEDLEKRVSIIAKVVGAIAQFGQLAISALNAASSASFWSKKDGDTISEMMKLMNGFLKETSKTMKELVKEIIEIAQSIPEKELKNVETVANIIGSIAQLASALTGPIKTFSEIKGDWFSESAGQKITNITNGLKDIMEKLKGTMPDLVKAFTKIPLEGFTKEKSEMLKNVLEGISSMSSAVLAIMSEMKDISSSDMITKIDQSFKFIEHSIDKTKSLIPKIKDLSSELDFFKEGTQANMIKEVVSDIKEINNALSDLGSVNVKATVDKLGEKLKLETEVLNIERKPIQLNINLDLTMKAEDIEKSLLKVRDNAQLKRA